MDLQKKLMYTEMHVKGISEHRDVDASVRKAALNKVVDMCARESAKIDQEVAEQVAALEPPKAS